MLTARDLALVAPYINGRMIPSGSTRSYSIVNPASGQKIAEIPIGCQEDVDRAVQSARSTFDDQTTWSHAAPSFRKRALHRWADLIESNAARLDALDAVEMGKPVSIAFANANAAAGFVRFNAEAIDKVCGPVLPTDKLSTVYQRRVPRGVVAAVVPWNFPTYNACLKLAPALAAGNTVVLKPSELASQSGLALTRLATDAGIPPGVLNFVPGCGERVGKALAEHPDVNMLTFTGSTAVGKLMLQYAAKSNMKVVSAECGGKSPHIVFDDGLDLEHVADQLAGMIVLNQGQVCSVGSRVLVQESIERSLVEKLITRLSRTVPGDPQLKQTTYGPLVSLAHMNRVLSCIRTAAESGAELRYGGSRIKGLAEGYFVEPTLFTNVDPASALAQEEIFGPVLSVLRFRDIEQAITLANSTAYGLAAYVWSANTSTAFKVANAVHSSYTIVQSAAVNSEGPGHAFTCEPFGLSGIGYEGGMPGLESYMRRHTVWFNHG